MALHLSRFCFQRRAGNGVLQMFMRNVATRVLCRLGLIREFDKLELRIRASRGLPYALAMFCRDVPFYDAEVVVAIGP